ncbi:MOSC domain-containing protein [candidate division KSB3 bacterium]|uniref:MOSC domain-containing protein n=1 Tax=candidate division KSB3 bacterium TaxID=2044937 RepID=A0A9D5Q8M9_9BACT|nr:MOSC domain-containing protein [candidate division KSB3 bacterium]MBD3327031.1 MOSC domain-containing protein [candidate division KSB3 bacterium]
MENAWIFQINISPGGVPKLPVQQVKLTSLGLEGDEHNDKEVHGGPDKAVCLYSLERIKALQAEGHPLFPGATGENLTLTGLGWEHVTPGTRLRIGPDVLLEMTQYTEPCYKLTWLFKAEDISRMAQDQHPGWARLYARVLSPGDVRVGDTVTLES